jgi:hypothetical protein
MIVPSDAVEWKHAALQALFYSAINFALCFPIFVLTGSSEDLATNHPFWYYLRSFGIFFLCPILWPIAFVKFTKLKFFQKHWTAATRRRFQSADMSARRGSGHRSAMSPPFQTARSEIVALPYSAPAAG